MANTRHIKRATENQTDQMEQWLEGSYELGREYGNWVMVSPETSITFVVCSECGTVMLDSVDEFDSCWECGAVWE